MGVYASDTEDTANQNPREHVPMQPTRQKIVELLRERGQATVEELASAVGLTQMAVRHHLNVLYGENLVATSSVRRKNQPGRPQQVYALTEAASELFPEDYYHLVDYLLTEAKTVLGAAGLNEMLRRIAFRVLAERPRLPTDLTPEEQLHQLVQFLSDKGFTARWGREGDNYVIRMLACPYRQIARQYHEVCRLDMLMIKETLQVEPVRLSCMATGDEYCTYHVSQPLQLAANH